MPKDMTMPDEQILANARLVLGDEVVFGSLRHKDGIIVAIDHGAGVPGGAVDCGGDYVAPGLVELHTDNLERHLRPRPNVRWPHVPAILAHDAELAGVGITTVFNALRVGSIPTKEIAGNRRYAKGIAEQIRGQQKAGALKITHSLHLRAEMCSETLIEELAEFGAADGVGLLSLMDHTPGQRQFTDLSRLETHLRGKHNMGKSEFETYLAYRMALGARVGDAHACAAVSAAKRLGAVLASHDDTTAEHVAASCRRGVQLAEFPTTMCAARACRDRNLAVVAGAPNLVCGQSHYGNIAVSELAAEGLIDVLSSDYVPAALLQSAIRLGEIWGDLARALATVTSQPARRAGLSDRGCLKIGQRADLIRFRLAGQAPVLSAVWCGGARVS